MTKRCIIALLVLLYAGPAAANNPYGLMVWPAHGESLAMAAARAAALGIAWFRPPAQFVDRVLLDPRCAGCDDVRRLGLSLVVTVRNGGHDLAPPRPSSPPSDLDAYKRAVLNVIDAWHPAILVVENEENEPAFFTDGREIAVWDSGGDTAQAYGRELAAACAVAHAHGTACTNGGLSSEAAAALGWLALLDQGQSDRACDFARRAFYTEQNDDSGQGLCAYKTAADLPAAKRAELLRHADQLLAVYRSVPIDMVNFHWFGRDAVALAETAQAIAALTGKPVMSNEMGLHPADARPISIRPLLRAAFATGMKVVIWFSVDTPSTTSLFDSDDRLRPTGLEFAHQMSGLK